MSSKGSRVFINQLKAIDDDFIYYEKKKRVDVLTSSINYKLKTTLLKYDEEVDDCSNFLTTAGEVRVMKAITKIQKKYDKENLEEILEEELLDE